MSAIYTRSGDDGTTALGDGSRVSKDDLRVEAYGALDEANCRIGVARPALVDNDMDEILAFVQHRLFNCAATLAWVGKAEPGPKVLKEDVAAIEHAIDVYSERLPELKGFVLPGADEASARLHSARAGVRTAERAIIRLSKVQEIDPIVLAFINRSSDLLYVAARNAAYGNEMLWESDAKPPTITR